MASNRVLSRLFILALLSCLLMAGCANNNFAPVQKAVIYPSKLGRYRVRVGDTLYSIAWAHGLDYRELARMNSMGVSDSIYPGQYLIIYPIVTRENHKPWRARRIFRRQSQKSKTHSSTGVTRGRDLRSSSMAARVARIQLGPVRHWYWPAKGKIIGRYNPRGGKKGINIRGVLGSPIYAAAGGIVVYAGSGLPAYGKLIIIKNNSDYLSAYAHNQQVLVREGQRVKAKQIIAKMGHSGARQTMLHFEIRRAGRPVNPLHYLPTA